MNYPSDESYKPDSSESKSSEEENFDFIGSPPDSPVVSENHLPRTPPNIRSIADTNVRSIADTDVIDLCDDTPIPPPKSSSASLKLSANCPTLANNVSTKRKHATVSTKGPAKKPSIEGG
jgi:hypothetical protein